MKKYIVLSISLCALTLYAADTPQTGLDVDPEEVSIDEQALQWAKKQVIAAYAILPNDQRLITIPGECNATLFAKKLKKQFDIQIDSEEDISAEVTRWAQHFLATQPSFGEDGEEDQDGSGGLIVSEQRGTGNVSDEAEQDDSRDDDAPGGWMPQMPSWTGVATAPRRLIGAIVSVPGNVVAGAKQYWNSSDRPARPS